MNVLTHKYISLLGKECEITLKVKKDIPDMESYLYRFEVFMGDIIFGCDFTITDQKIKRYDLKENEIINICFDIIYGIVDDYIQEYCSMMIGKDNIIEYLVKQNDFGRIDM
jgi:hypothetical protein